MAKETEVNVNPQSALKSYAKVQYRSNVEVASPHKLIQMLFDGAIERIKHARAAMERGDIELKGKKINSAVSIVGGLRESLDDGQAGQLAMNLDDLYVYIQSILTLAHMKNDTSKLDEAIALLEEISGAWQQIG